MGHAQVALNRVQEAVSNLTRARDAVYLSTFKRINRKVLPSRFLAEIAGDPIPAPATLPLPGAPAAPLDEELPPLEVTFSELAVFESGRDRLRECVVIQTEMSFIPLYEGQPVFWETDRLLRSLGFVPHAFAAIKRCHEVVHERGAPRISSTIKLGTRTDRDQSMQDKVDSVRRKL